MATYNGERHIREQLESLSSQIHLPWELQIGDDGSSDGTLSIIEFFSKSAPFPVKLHRNSKTLGYAQNFIQTARRCAGDWVAFCDQDDVWMPNKLMRCAELVSASNEDTHLVVHAVAIVDDDLRPTGQSFPPKPRSETHAPLTRPLFWSHQGSSQLVRMDLLTDLDHSVRAPTVFTNVDPYPHDSWFALLGNVLGKSVELDEPLGLYRRHRYSVSQAGKQRNEFGVRELLSTGAEHYRHMEEVSQKTARCLRHQCNHVTNPLWRERLIRASNRFELLAKAYDHRANVYAQRRLGKRASHLFKLIVGPGYFGLGPSSFGVRSFCKDLVFCIFHSNRRRPYS